MDRRAGAAAASWAVMRSVHVGFTLLAGWLTVSVLACTDEAGTGGGGGSGTESTTAAGSGKPLADPGCEGPLGRPIDPSTLPACCPDYGAAHCLDSIPPELESAAAPCDGGGYCVPDVFLETGGVYTPPACTSLAGAAGVCLSACIPDVAANANLLPMDVCAEHERCVPCISPLDQTETGACKIGFSCGGQGTGGGPPTVPPCDDPATCEYDLDTTCEGQPAADPELFAACPADVCQSGGHCVPAGAIPAEQAGLLADCDASSKCVPDVLIETAGLFTPPSCTSVAEAEGRCLSVCLPDVAAQSDLLPVDVCGAEERCVPCYDPFDGTETGACGLSECDAGPTQPPKTFAKCCAEKGGGTCLPVSLVGQEAAEQLDTEECQEDLLQAGSVCVPDALYEAHAQGLLYQGAPCETGFLVQLFGASEEGACLPQCIPEVDDALFVGQEDCQDGFNCVPCTDQSGESTGACDPQ